MNFLVEVDEELDFNEAESPLTVRHRTDHKSMRPHARSFHDQNRSFVSPREEGEAYSEDESESVIQSNNNESKPGRPVKHIDREEGEASSEDERRFESDLRRDKKFGTKRSVQIISNTMQSEKPNYQRNQESFETWSKKDSDIASNQPIFDLRTTLTNKSNTSAVVTAPASIVVVDEQETIEELDVSKKYQSIRQGDTRYKSNQDLTTNYDKEQQPQQQEQQHQQQQYLSADVDDNTIDELKAKYFLDIHDQLESNQSETIKRKLKSKKSKRDRREKEQRHSDKSSLVKQRRKEAKQKSKFQHLSEEYYTEWEPAQKLSKSGTNHYHQQSGSPMSNDDAGVDDNDSLEDTNRLNRKLTGQDESPSLTTSPRMPPPPPAPHTSHRHHHHHNRKQISYNEDESDNILNAVNDDDDDNYTTTINNSNVEEFDENYTRSYHETHRTSDYTRPKRRHHYRRETRESAPPPESNRTTNYTHFKPKYSGHNKFDDRRLDRSESTNSQTSDSNRHSWRTNEHKQSRHAGGGYGNKYSKVKYDTLDPNHGDIDNNNNNDKSENYLAVDKSDNKPDGNVKKEIDPLSLISNRKIQEHIRSRYDSLSESESEADDVDEGDGDDDDDAEVEADRDGANDEDGGAGGVDQDADDKKPDGDHIVDENSVDGGGPAQKVSSVDELRKRLERIEEVKHLFHNETIDKLESRIRAELSELQNYNLDESVEKRSPGKPFYYPSLQGCRSVEEFECLNRIEEGTYGVVYRARDKKINEIVALKRLKMEKERNGFPITSLREINTLMKAQHENIVTVREVVVGSNMDKIYIVMDYVEHDLKSLMEIMNGPFSVGEVKCLLLQLLRAVKHLHDNWILHRDLKTSNLLLSHQGILKVGDFGLAREYGSPLKHYTEVVVTLWYRAPELLLGAKQYACPIDLWSVGCIFAEFLLQRPLFPGKGEVDELNIVFRDLGTPTERIWPGVSQLPGMKKCVFTEYPYNQLRRRFTENQISDHGFDLLNSLLTYCPDKRITADKALTHSYFNERPRAIHPSMFPTWPAKSEGAVTVKHASPRPPAGGGALAAAAAAVAAAAAAAAQTTAGARMTYQPPAPPMGGQRFYSMGDSRPSTQTRNTLGSGDMVPSNPDKGFLLRF